MRPGLRNLLYAAFCLVCLLAVVWPGYPMFGNSVEPRFFGLPFSLSWNILWMAISAVGLLIFHFTSEDS